MPSEHSDGGAVCCIRTSLIIFNTIALLAGLGTLAIGVYLLFHDFSVANESDVALVMESSDNFLLSSKDLKLISTLVLIIGGLVTFVSLIGCLGACFKARCLLMSYLVTVILILTLQLLVGICAFFYREEISIGLHDELMSNLKKDYDVTPKNSVKRNWDVMQHHVQCCGVNGYDDWYNAKAWPGKNYVPDSCCTVTNVTAGVVDGCGRNGNTSTWYNNGCLEVVKAAFMERLHIMASLIVTLIFLQLYGIVASTLLFYHSKIPKPKSPQYKAYLYERARM